MNRICKKCNIDLPIKKFKIVGKYRLKTCMSCLYLYYEKPRVNKDPLKKQKALIARKRYKIQNNSIINQKEKNRYSNNKEKYWARSLEKIYGISAKDYKEILGQQNYVCAICEDTNSNGKRLGVDHSHLTGKVRGILCSDCNMALGKFFDDYRLLEKASQYLRKFEDNKD